MSVRVSSLFVLPCVSSDLVTRLIPRSWNPTNYIKDPQLQINFDENRSEGLIPNVEEEEEEEEDVKLGISWLLDRGHRSVF
jgi:hypothetical protein